MKIWVCMYDLNPVDPRFKPRAGALIKAEWALEQIGYSDLHPWPEFGDAALPEHLLSLRAVQPTPLAKRSLDFNYIDREFRLRKKNAFAGLILPRSHRLVTDIRTLDSRVLNEWHKAGFTHLKVKMGHDLAAETEILLQLVYVSPLFWRIDLNGKLSAAHFGSWWESLGADVHARIDLVEDPTAADPVTVEGPWANDWYAQARAKIRIVKPAREEATELSRYDRFIFTHAMDHTLGQACAAWSAARFYSDHPKKMDICGLAAPELYAPDAFANEWLCAGPRLKPTTGTGFGFDEILNGLKWERLV